METCFQEFILGSFRLCRNGTSVCTSVCFWDGLPTFLKCKALIMHVGSGAAVPECLQGLQNWVEALLMIWHHANNRFCLDGFVLTWLCNIPEFLSWQTHPSFCKHFEGRLCLFCNTINKHAMFTCANGSFQTDGMESPPQPPNPTNVKSAAELVISAFIERNSLYWQHRKAKP